MGKKHIVVLEVLAIILLIMLTLVYSSTKNNKKEICTISQELGSLNNSLSQIDSKTIKQSVDYLNTLITKAQNNVSDITTQISNFSKEETEPLVKKLTLLQDNQNQLIKEFNNLSSYVRESTDESKLATEAFRFASDHKKSYSERKYYYLNAIMHNPTEPTYYNSYIEFLNNNKANIDEYWTIATILDSAMTQMKPSAIEQLLPIYESIYSTTHIEETKDNEDSINSYEIWQDNAKIFFEKITTGNFSYKEIETYYNAATLAYESIEELDNKTQTKYELMNNLYSLYSSYFSLLDLYKKMMSKDMDDATFISSYPIASQIVESVKSAFLISSFEENFKKTINRDYNEICSFSNKLNTKYDSIRACQLFISLQSLVSETNRVVSRIKNASNNSGYQMLTEWNTVLEKYKEIQLRVSTYASSITIQESVKDITKMQELLSQIQKNIYTIQFTDYQLWASKILTEAEKVKQKEDNEQLEALFSLGYFEINPSLLIPQLYSLYNSIDVSSMEKKSTVTFEQLVSKYKPVIKGIGEV